ncbi:MAG TPA: hypothetical protein VLL25_01320 [Acidimicrobiales bacterium]|nr:hypothetical protein [Acidimicrobiales bacterium]
MRGHRTKGWRARCAAALVAIAVLAGACGGARNSLGTTASPCFRAVPGAKEAVRSKGNLVGVRLVSTSTLQKRIPNDQQLAAVRDRQLCVFAFHDDYHAGDVPGATNQDHGQYAVVALTIKSPKVVATFLLDRLPTRFRHLR